MAIKDVLNHEEKKNAIENKTRAGAMKARKNGYTIKYAHKRRAKF